MRFLGKQKTKITENIFGVNTKKSAVFNTLRAGEAPDLAGLEQIGLGTQISIGESGAGQAPDACVQSGSEISSVAQQLNQVTMEITSEAQCSVCSVVLTQLTTGQECSAGEVLFNSNNANPKVMPSSALCADAEQTMQSPRLSDDVSTAAPIDVELSAISANMTDVTSELSSGSSAGLLIPSVSGESLQQGDATAPTQQVVKVLEEAAVMKRVNMLEHFKISSSGVIKIVGRAWIVQIRPNFRE